MTGNHIRNAAARVLSEDPGAIIGGLCIMAQPFLLLFIAWGAS